MSLFDSTDNLQPDPAQNFDTRAKQLAQRRKLAQDLIAQSFNAPAGQMVGPVYVANNPWGNFAKALGGSYMNSQADKQEAELALQQRMAQQDWSDRYNAATPEQQQGLLIEARNRGLKYDLEQAFAKEQADRIERGEQAAAERQNRADIAEANRIDQGEQRAADRVSRQELRATPTVHITNSGGGLPKAPPGYMWNADNTGQVAIPGGPADIKNKAAAEKSPGGIAANDARATNTYLDQAEKLLPKATGSGIGSVADSAASIVGYSTPGAKAAAELRVVAGYLTSKVPKMSGPQSDRDVQMYKQMAGDLGNEKLPVETRLAAARTMRELNNKYKHLNSPTESAGQWDASKEQRYQEWKARNGK